MSAEIIIGVVVVAAFAYLLIERWQIQASEGAREELVNIAGQMLGSPAYPDEQKDMISDMLDEAMDRWFMVQMVVRLPWSIWRRLTRHSSVADRLVFDQKFNRFLYLHFKCTSAANPLFAAIFRVEIALMVLLLGLIVSTAIVAATAARVASKLSRDPNGNCHRGMMAR